MTEIALHNRYQEVVAYATVDDCDFWLIKFFSWHRANGYARAKINGKNIYMHQLIKPCKEGFEVDHKNGNKLDNTRSNLRVVTKRQQRQNLGCYRTKGRTSRYRGVSWDKRYGKWRAQVKVDGKKIYLGRFLDEEEAARIVSEYRQTVFTHTNEDRKQG